MDELDRLLEYATENNDLDTIAPLVKGITEAQEAKDNALGEVQLALDELQTKYNTLSDWTISALKRQPTDDVEEVIDENNVEDVSDAIALELDEEEA